MSVSCTHIYIDEKKTWSDNLAENKSGKYQTHSTGFQSLPPKIKLHKSSTPFISSNSVVSPSTTIPISNTLFHQRDVKEKMSNSLELTESKVTSLRDSSASSLISTQLLTTTYDQTKADVTITTPIVLGSN